MKTIKSLKDITTLEVGDKIIFGNSEYKVKLRDSGIGYYLYYNICSNNTIFLDLHLNIESFCNHLGINILNKHHLHDGSFPETKSLEALTAIVSALFKEFEKQNELPKTWDEFCEKNPFKRGECYISPCCNIIYTERVGRSRNADEDRSSCTSQQEAEAFIALMQLRQLRKCYVGDWEPNGITGYWGIYLNHLGTVHIVDTTTHLKVLSFPTYELAAQFAYNFKNLLKIANPLL